MSGVSIPTQERRRELEQGFKFGTFEERVSIGEALLEAGYTPEDFARLDEQALATRDARLLEDIAAFIRRFVILTGEQLTVIALWVIHTFAIEASSSTPYLIVSSPEKRSGKSRLREVLDMLVLGGWSVTRVSEAVLYRRLAMGEVTLLLDESDRLFHSKGTDSQEGIIAALNAGHRRGMKVPRCVGRNRDEIAEFETYGPKAFFGIETPRNPFPDTIKDRGFVVEMKRRRPNERVEDFYYRDEEDRAKPLRDQSSDWVTRHIEELRIARPVRHPALRDRAGEAADPLLAIADIFGNGWGEKARLALVALAPTDEDFDSEGSQLLLDLRTVLARLCEPESVRTEDLLRGLRETDALWGRFHRGSPVEARDLAKLLHPYGARPRKLRFGAETARGYLTVELRDAFDRYLLPEHAEQAEQVRPNTSVDVVPAPGETGNGAEQNSGLPFLVPECSVPVEGRVIVTDDRSAPRVPFVPLVPQVSDDRPGSPMAAHRRSVKPCSTCGCHQWSYNERGDSWCSECFPGSAAKR